MTFLSPANFLADLTTQIADTLSSTKSYLPLLEEIGLKMIFAILIFIVGWFVARLIGRAVRKIVLSSGKIDSTVVPMLSSTVEWIIKILVIVSVLGQFGVQTASLIAMLGAAGLAIGLALQGTLQNISAGIMLLILRPIRTGESVSLAGISGKVDEIGLFLTRIIQWEGTHVTIPNSTVWGSVITNNSRNPVRRMDLPIRIHYGEDIDKAIEVLTEVANSNPLTVFEPAAPSVFVNSHQDSVIVLNMRIWCQSSDWANLSSEFLKLARQALEANGFNLPVPIQKRTIEA